MPTGQLIDTISALRDLPIAANDLILVLGYYTPHDGGGGYFYWDAAHLGADNRGTIILPHGQPSLTAGRWVRTSPENGTTTNGNTGLTEPRQFELNVRQFGAGSGDHTGRTDTCAIQTAIDSVPLIGSARIVIPPGNYYISNIHISRAIILEGVGDTAGHGDVTLWVVEGHGLIVDSLIGILGQYSRWVDPSAPITALGSCSGILVNGSPSSGQGAIIRNLAIYKSRSATGPTQDGIRVYASCKITDVLISEMEGNGITIASEDFNAIYGLTYAAGWYLERILVALCQDGLHVRGGNTGDGLCVQFKSTQNKGYGFRDVGTVGNTYVAASSEGDVNGFYATDPNANHTFVGCYFEGKGENHFDGSSSIIIGGHLGGALEGSRVSHRRSRLSFYDDKATWPGLLHLDIPRGDQQAAFRFAFQQHGLTNLPGDWYLKRFGDIEHNSVPEDQSSSWNSNTFGHLNGEPSRSWGIWYQDPGWRSPTPRGTIPIGWTDEYHPRGVGHPFFQKALLNQRAIFSKRMTVALAPSADELIDFLWSDWLLPEPEASVSVSFAIEFPDDASLRTGDLRIMGYTLVADPSNPQKHNLCKVRLRNESSVAATIVLVGHFEMFKLWRDGNAENYTVM